MSFVHHYYSTGKAYSNTAVPTRNHDVMYRYCFHMPFIRAIQEQEECHDMRQEISVSYG